MIVARSKDGTLPLSNGEVNARALDTSSFFNSMIKLPPQNIRFLIIHHTATLRDKTTFWAVRKYHIQKGWEEIGYHYFITPEKVYKGRNEDFVGCHCKFGGYNFKSLSICLTGNFENEKPTASQISFLGQVVNDLCLRYNIARSNILGHSETGAATLCPGKHLLPYIKALRDNIDISPKEKESVLEKIAAKLREIAEAIKRLGGLLNPI